MTENDFERRLRKIEDWCLAHDVKCEGRDEKLVGSVEVLKKSLERESAAGKITDARIDALKDEIGGMKVKLAFIAGFAAAGGGVIGSWFSQLIQ